MPVVGPESGLIQRGMALGCPAVTPPRRLALAAFVFGIVVTGAAAAHAEGDADHGRGPWSGAAAEW
ncbi:hypothetical protein [Caldovatus aquaticus]|uniref:Uncharacterized protein n=1 Tax=Caldovatus aquaticus TaxID=2865671 RepID=A0ABS7EZN5_9PROT|nr:hypothetical protein [Caldovatus aquaticus]MBW8268826.1 hypothetical protein [Caldovatus aquaticus]